jgi:ribosomal protein L6P/L9E
MVLLHKKLVFVKKKKTKFLYLEDLYSNNFVSSSLIASSDYGINFMRLVFPKMHVLGGSIFYAPVYIEMRISIAMVIKQVKLFLKGLTQGFFLEFRMVGLGFKVKRTGGFFLKGLKFDIGFSHFTKVPLSGAIRLYRIKRRFLLFSIDYTSIKILLKQIQNIRKHNPYKMRGLKLSGAKVRVKAGKKQTKR